MTPHLYQHIPRPRQQGLVTVRRLQYRKWVLLPLAALVLAFALPSCSGGSSQPSASSVPVTDTRPVGEGLKVIGFAMLGAAVVLVVGRMVRL